MSALTKLYRGETRLNFIATRRWWYLASAIFVLICILSFIFRGFQYGVEFKGGSTFYIPTPGTRLFGLRSPFGPLSLSAYHF